MVKVSSVWADLYERKSSRALKKQRHLARYVRPWHRSCLELFSATGQNAEVFRRLAPEAICVGVDYDRALCRIARGKGMIALAADCRALPFKERSFDLIYVNSFHHIWESAEETMRACLDLLRPGGVLVGVEPYGLVSRILADVICSLPDGVLAALPDGLAKYTRAIKYECRNEGVRDWYHRFDFGRALSAHGTAARHRDLFRIYYCIEKR